MSLRGFSLDGFEVRRSGRRITIAMPECIEELARVDPEGLPIANHGRSALRRLKLQDGRHLLLRQYRRGGLLRHINASRYLSPRRALDEIRVCREAASRGVPVPVAIGAILEQAALFWQCWLAVEEIEDASDLGAYLRRLPAVPTREIAVEKRLLTDALAAAIRQMHDAGLWHADLQARNILLRRSPSGVEVFFIDLDKSRIADPLPEKRRAANLRRLNRSILKMRLDPPPIDDDDRRRFIAAYRAGDALFGNDVSALLQGCRRHAAWHSIAWRIFRQP